MKVAFGSTRIVIVGKQYTVKCAHFHPLMTVHELVGCAKRGKQELKLFMSAPETAWGGFKNIFLRGVLCNKREAKYSTELGEIAVPTRFSLFGIFNIQETASSHRYDRGLLWKIFFDIIGKDLRAADHTFAGEQSFGMHGGRMKIIDYGSARFPELLIKHKQEIIKALGGLDYSAT